jgi:hypothetical protein
MRRAAVVQYRTSADSAEHNRSVEDVLIELGTCDPGGLTTRCSSSRTAGFLHVAVFDGTTDPFADCGAHREFHRGLGSACGPADHQPRGADRVVLRQQEGRMPERLVAGQRAQPGYARKR